MSTVCILGLGVVGVPQTIAFDSEGHDVIGYDIDEQKIETLKQGQDPNEELDSEQVERSDVTFTADPSVIQGVDYVIITVSTPIDAWNRPDLSIVSDAGETVGEHLERGTTVVLESTVYPGATREVLIPAIERGSGFDAGSEFSVGYSPERISPNVSGFKHTAKIVSGQDEATRDDIASLYRSVLEEEIHLAPTMATAEAAKCLENVQRDVNIALVNEFAMGCGELDIELDPRDVLEAAQTKWNFHPYEPGLVGGHCIPVDPYFMISRFERNGFAPEIMRRARNVNDEYPRFVAERVMKEIAGTDRSESTGPERPTADRNRSAASTRPRVLVMGIAYKANTNDVRNPALEQMLDELEQYNAELFGFDPNVPNEVIEDRFDIAAIEDPDFSAYDALVVTTLHDEFHDLQPPSRESDADSPVLVDLTGNFSSETARDEYVAPTYRV
ncbi:nucleotide sugar dehydrogenase [Haloterrigena alkaliphila]|uniref:UDP-N-acetyl-D-mannosamine dehydrogenase n=1 Tax=Haloterrigena alkaliphila TaxID=2816475 RepID=A0A8A2VI75_9EURY|nr:nucleotide sugar dehydrogenase [Haloterrigena alkaliphila]QSX00033.1 nucleotide sugar dehydrogenase [Haloterrigena alkaliphila]